MGLWLITWKPFELVGLCWNLNNLAHWQWALDLASLKLPSVVQGDVILVVANWSRHEDDSVSQSLPDPDWGEVLALWVTGIGYLSLSPTVIRVPGQQEG